MKKLIKNSVIAVIGLIAFSVESWAANQPGQNANKVDTTTGNTVDAESRLGVSTDVTSVDTVTPTKSLPSTTKKKVTRRRTQMDQHEASPSDNAPTNSDIKNQ